MKKLEGKVAIITGSSRGIGRAIALLFAEEGAKVVVNYARSKGKANEVVEEIRKIGSDAVAIKCDVSNEKEVNEMVISAAKKFGKIDILVNNAGVYIHNEALEFDEANWNSIIDTNLKGVMLCTTECAKFMLEQKSGAIVNISSIYGLTNFAGASAYGSSKAGVIYLTKLFAKDFGPNTRVNAIAPGLINTEMTANDPEGIKQVSRVAPLKRIGNPEEIAKAALFLASDDSSYITGDVLIVDGGYHLRE